MNPNRVKHKVGRWLVSVLLCAVSFEGLWTMTYVWSSAGTLAQQLVAVCHVSYVVAGIAVVIGIWRSVRSTWIAVAIWGAASLGAALGGPAAFGPPSAMKARVAGAVSIAIVLITAVLLVYVRRITCDKVAK